ncbi:MAG: HlyC/CorC family transporter, partial [Planctomycetota bacterium]
MDGTQLLLLLLAFFLVLLNGFFVAAEFAFVKVRASRIEQLVREGAGSRGRVARRILGQLDGYLAACQFGITLASLGLGWVGEPALGAWLEPLFEALGFGAPAAARAAAVVIAFTLITFLHVVVGEQAPKSLGIMRAEPVALWAAWPLRLFYVLAYPAIALLSGSTNAFLRLLGLPPASEHEHAHSPEELSMAVETSHEQGLLDAEQRRLLENALALRNRCLREIMVPRPDMHVLDIEASVESNIETLCRHHHTRYPLARGDADRIVGMIHIKDLVPFPCDTKREPGERGEETSRLLEPERLLAIARPITFIPEVAPIDRALRTFQASGSHMAMVVDEWGGVVGLVTLEDVLEELVG